MIDPVEGVHVAGGRNPKLPLLKSALFSGLLRRFLKLTLCDARPDDSEDELAGSAPPKAKPNGRSKPAAKAKATVEEPEYICIFDADYWVLSRLQRR